MRNVIAPRLGEPTAGTRTCVDGREFEITKILRQFLEIGACAGLLVLLFATKAILTLWSGCAWGARCAGSLLVPAGRITLIRIRLWRRAIHVFTLGVAASWTAEGSRARIKGDKPAASGMPASLRYQGERSWKN